VLGILTAHDAANLLATAVAANDEPAVFAHGAYRRADFHVAEGVEGVEDGKIGLPSASNCWSERKR
jgi:hypothetical protein